MNRIRVDTGYERDPYPSLATVLTWDAALRTKAKRNGWWLDTIARIESEEQR